MIYGFDVSHHNGENAVTKCLQAMPEAEFVIIKATEGRTLVDKRCLRNIEQAEKSGLLFGLYHYARPEINTSVEEAINFMQLYRPYVGKAVPVLDWEGESLKKDPMWAREWLDYIYYLTKVRPVLYVQQSEVAKMGVVESGNYGLWIARYRSTQSGFGSCAPWKFAFMWQHTSSPFDKNILYGNADTFKKYAIPEYIEDNKDDCDCNCHYCGCSCNNQKE